MEQRYKLKPVDKRLRDVNIQVKKYIHNLLLECDKFLEEHSELFTKEALKNSEVKQDFENYDKSFV